MTEVSLLYNPFAAGSELTSSVRSFSGTPRADEVVLMTMSETKSENSQMFHTMRTQCPKHRHHIHKTSVKS